MLAVHLRYCMTKKIFLDEIKRLQNQKTIKGANYYCITFLGNESGKISFSCISRWDGFVNNDPSREIRKASFIIPKILRKTFNDLNEPALIVNTDEDMLMFKLFGGNGIIEETIAKKHLPPALEPQETVFTYYAGFTQIDSIPLQKLNRAPTKKTRMNVIKRDSLKCAICGRSPKNYTDIELHVHHIKPFSKRGLTEEDNLITLCNTCHDGLDPHDDSSLYELIGIGFLEKGKLTENDYWVGIRNYQKIIFSIINKKKLTITSTQS